MRGLIFTIPAAILLAATAAEAKITISKAEITGGKLVVTGKSTTGSKIKLDDTFTANINSSDTFKFALTYLPEDCIVDLQVVGASAIKKAVVAKCASSAAAPELLDGTGTTFDPSAVRQFTGPLVRKTVKSGQRLVVTGLRTSFTATMNSGIASGGKVELCHRLVGQTALNIFDEKPLLVTYALTNTTPVGITVINSMISTVPATAGEYDVGLCASSPVNNSTLSNTAAREGMVYVLD
jgi:hypothetical protein